jgi:CRISPR-associated protein Cas5d
VAEGRSPTLRLRAMGPLACFSRPELKVERMSYAVMTPSAARGLLEAVLWKPAIVWRVERILVLNPIRFLAFRRNEVNSKAVSPPRQVVESGGEITHYFADKDRAQRNTVALRDVDYLVEAHFEMTAKAGQEDSMAKFVDMFTRRVERGQHFHQPYFGCREFVAHVAPAENAPAPVQDSRDLGMMLYDIDYSERPLVPLFFHAKLKKGVLEVPRKPLRPAATKGGSA